MIQSYSAQTTPKYPYTAIFDPELLCIMPHRELLLLHYYQDMQAFLRGISRQAVWLLYIDWGHLIG